MNARSAAAAPAAPRLRRGRAVLAILLLGAALLATTLGTWVSAPVQTTLGSDVARVSGTQAAPHIASLALVILAAGLALSLAGRAIRVVAAVIVALAGAICAVSAIAVLGSPDRPALAAAAQLTGVSELAGTVSVSAWPYVCVALSVLALVVGAMLPFVVGQWGAVGRRYERSSAQAPTDGAGAGLTGRTDGAVSKRTARMHDWDAQSRGEDPSEGVDR